MQENECFIQNSEFSPEIQGEFDKLLKENKKKIKEMVLENVLIMLKHEISARNSLEISKDSPKSPKPRNIRKNARFHTFFKEKQDLKLKIPLFYDAEPENSEKKAKSAGIFSSNSAIDLIET